MTTALERSKAIPPDPTMPTLQEELDRKTLDAIERLIADYDNGTIAHRELRLATRTLFDAVSGLVNPGIIHLISEIDKLPAEGRASVVRRFAKGDKLAVIERSLSRPTISLTTVDIVPGTYHLAQKSFSDEVGAFRASHDHFEQTCAKLIGKGFLEAE